MMLMMMMMMMIRMVKIIKHLDFNANLEILIFLRHRWLLSQHVIKYVASWFLGSVEGKERKVKHLKSHKGFLDKRDVGTPTHLRLALVSLSFAYFS